MYLEMGGYCPSSLVALDKQHGEVVWELSETVLRARTDEVLIADEVGVGRGDLVALDPATGQIIWRLPYGQCGLPPEFLFENDMFCHAPGGAVSGLDPRTGAKLWETEAQDLGIIQEVTAGAVYVSACRLCERSLVRVFNRQTGQECWDTEVAGFLGEIDGVAVVSQSALGYTWALDALTGNVLWRNDDLLLTGIAGVSHGTLIGWRTAAPGSYGGFVFGIDFESGERKWRLDDVSAGQLTSPGGKQRPLHVIGDNLIYTTGETLVVLDPQTGETVSSIPLPGLVFDFQPRGDNVLFTGTSALCEVHLPLAAPSPTATPPLPTAAAIAPTPPCGGCPSIDEFVGYWTNADVNSLGSPAIDIQSQEGELLIHAWGSCTPEWCDWGTERVPYDNHPFTFTWQMGFVDITWRVEILDDGELHVHEFHHFLDDSGRPDLTFDWFFVK
jgi:outer membrane protein assembly factor BamB